MPFCKTCGTYFPKSLGVCPTCNAHEVLHTQDEPPALAPEEQKKFLLRRWLSICVLVPGLIGFIYLIYYIMFQLKS